MNSETRINEKKYSYPQIWDELSGGRNLQLCIQRQLNHLLPEYFGYYGLALGQLSTQLSLAKSPVRYWFHGKNEWSNALSNVDDRLSKISSLQEESFTDDLNHEAAEVISKHHAGHDLIVDYQHLPFQSDALDVVFAPHVLDFFHEPHQFLRELGRVIIPDGFIILTGMNPVSWYGMQTLLRRTLMHHQFEKQRIGLSRIKDWLLLLGFSVCHCTALNTLGLRKKGMLQHMTHHVGSRFSSHYFIVAQKRVHTITPIRPKLKHKKSLVTSSLVKPSTRQ